MVSVLVCLLAVQSAFFVNADKDNMEGKLDVLAARKLMGKLSWGIIATTGQGVNKDVGVTDIPHSFSFLFVSISFIDLFIVKISECIIYNNLICPSFQYSL